MDKQELAAYSGREQASVKHFLLKAYLERLMMITGQHFNRIAYVDAFAGPWKSANADLSDTSFASAVKVMQDCQAKLLSQFGRKVPMRALFVERDPDRYAVLKQYVDQRSSKTIELTSLAGDFAESASAVAQWIEDDEIAFVLIDPTGWKNIISPQTLTPLLRKRNVEVLINVMWNFISLASGHANQEDNLRQIFGEEFDNLRQSPPDGETWIRAYLRALKSASNTEGNLAPLRTAWFPVEFPSQERVFYYLIYGTHHSKGIIVFLEESERALEFQKTVKFAVHQRQRETKFRVADLFGDQIQFQEQSQAQTIAEAREAWLQLLPVAGSESLVDEVCVAQLAEQAGCLLSHLQSALKELIDDSVMANKDAKRARTKNHVNFKKGEHISRIK